MNDALGVALTHCYYCGEADRIVLNTHLTPKYADRVKEMHGKVIDLEPCEKCRKLLDQGVFMFEIDPDKSPDKGEPYRTGRMAVVTKEAAGYFLEGVEPDLLRQQMVDFAEKRGVIFLDIETYTKFVAPAAHPEAANGEDEQG